MRRNNLGPRATSTDHPRRRRSVMEAHRRRPDKFPSALHAASRVWARLHARAGRDPPRHQARQHRTRFDVSADSRDHRPRAQ